MRKIKEAIIVEGRYDANKLHQMVDTMILETGGFQIFSQKQLLHMIRTLAEKRGIIVLTDSDGAGFLIRNYLTGSIPSEQIKHAYIPDIYGKESRKRTPSKEGKLGVEGMRPEVLYRALERAGVTFLDEQGGASLPMTATAPMTKADLYALGLSGRADSVRRRKKLLKQLDLPEHLSSNAFLMYVNTVMDREKVMKMIEEIR